MTSSRSIDSFDTNCVFQSQRLRTLERPRRMRLLLACLGLLLVFVTVGCEQKRYTPAKWRSISKGETTLPEMVGEMGTLPSGRGTLPDRMGTLPGRMGTLPGRMGTLPGRMGTLPGRMQTLPGRSGTLPVREAGNFRRFGELTDWFNPNSPTGTGASAGENSGRAGTTLPSRSKNGITLP